jgi:hypothetical protein
MYDGEMLSNRTISFAHPPVPLPDPFYIGRDGNFPERMFKGMVDDVRIYDYSLSENQIRQIIENKEPQVEAGSVILAELPGEAFTQAGLFRDKAIDVTRLDDTGKKKLVLVMAGVIVAVFLLFVVLVSRPKS